MSEWRVVLTLDGQSGSAAGVHESDVFPAVGDTIVVKYEAGTTEATVSDVESSVIHATELPRYRGPAA
jgi:hypothetical protein